MNSLNKFLMTLETHFPSPSTSWSSLSCTDTVCTSAFSGKLVHSNFLKKLFYFLTSTLGNQARHLCVPLCDDLPPTTKSPWVYFSLFNISHLWGNFTFYCETSVTRLGDFWKLYVTDSLSKVAQICWLKNLCTFEKNYCLIYGQLLEKLGYFVFQHLVTLYETNFCQQVEHVGVDNYI